MAVNRDSASRGFTLIEVVVSLAILSLVLLGTVTGLRTLGNTHVSLERVTQRADEVRTVSAFLRDLMESAVVGSGSGGLTLGGGSSAASYFRSGKGFLDGKLTSCSESPMEELMWCELVQRAINLY
jgi:general secretion pathway protein J